MRAATEHRRTMFLLIENWQQSGLSQKAFCEQQQIVAHQFYYWYKCYGIQNDVPAVQVTKGFIELHSHGPSPEAAIETLLSCGHRIFFHQPVAASFLKLGNIVFFIWLLIPFDHFKQETDFHSDYFIQSAIFCKDQCGCIVIGNNFYKFPF